MRAISALTSTVTNLASAMKDQAKNVQELASAAKRVHFRDAGEVSSDEEGGGNRHNSALMRNNPKRRKQI